MNNNKVFESLLNIAQSTIGFDLTPTIPINMTKEEQENYKKKCEKEGVPYISNKPIELPKYYDGIKPYKPTKEEVQLIIECINQISHPNDYLKNLDDYEVRINDYDEILVRTDTRSWMCLSGREWLIDMKNKNAKLVCMS